MDYRIHGAYDRAGRRFEVREAGSDDLRRIDCDVCGSRERVWFSFPRTVARRHLAERHGATFGYESAMTPLSRWLTVVGGGLSLVLLLVGFAVLR
ncbi:hypothetical protein [Streptomyces sp. SID3343]|uniref:hypothetical protein n=1 Tax=Streptomyces sp. SID3343 TaxID=2690260 RepID=UPI001368AB99|nr:hypothetical protein [Streptomyces sp. SID3343]MYW02586.1 hypothetical protein [Streptomyces sp. SID3343]